jgi:hypothetical protein
MQGFARWFKSTLINLYHWKIQFIRRYPVLSAYVAFLEGVLLGLIIYHYLFQARFSCCLELGH